MGTSEKFQTFCSNLRMSQSTVNNVSSRYKQITKRLNLDFYFINSEIRNSLYVGSYGRGTAIHVSDIDILFILPSSLYNQYSSYSGNGQSALLQEVKNSIKKTYSSTHLGADGQVIKLDFSDGICYEIVPCFENTDGSFTFPDSNNGGSWKRTNPKPEISEINTANKNWNHNLKPLCRMIRAWKDEWDVKIGGLLIDTFAYNFLKSWEYKNNSFLYYDWMTRDFFEYLKNLNEEQYYWLAPGSNQHVWKSEKFRDIASKCYDISLDAVDYEKNNYEWSANKKWRQIYGSKFPS